MKAKWLKATVSGILLLLFLAILLLQPSVFIYPLSANPFIPLGNLLFWLALIAFPVFLEGVSSGFPIPFPKTAGMIGKLFALAVILAALWWPVSYLLAGNFANNFRMQEEFVGSSRAADWFWGYSYAVALLPMLLWLARVVLSLAGRFRK